MRQLSQCIGAEAPTFYMIRFQNQHTTVAMRMRDVYLFRDGSIWRSVSAEFVDAIIQSIDEGAIARFGELLQSASTLSIQLLIMSRVFHLTPPIFAPLATNLEALAPKRDRLGRKGCSVYSIPN